MLVVFRTCVLWQKFQIVCRIVIALATINNSVVCHDDLGAPYPASHRHDVSERVSANVLMHTTELLIVASAMTILQTIWNFCHSTHVRNTTSMAALGCTLPRSVR